MENRLVIDLHEKKERKRYLLQKKEPFKDESVVLHTQETDVPYRVYFTYRFSFKKGKIKTLDSLNKFIAYLQTQWEDKKDIFFIQKLTLATRMENFYLILALAYEQKEYEQELVSLKKWLIKKIETYEDVSILETKFLKKNVEEVEKKVQQMDHQLSDFLNRYKANEKRYQEEQTKLYDIIAQQAAKLIYLEKGTQTKKERVEQVSSRNPKQHYILNKEKSTILFKLKEKKITQEATFLELRDLSEVGSKFGKDIDVFPSLTEEKILSCFERAKSAKKMKLIPLKALIKLRNRLECIEYLWTVNREKNKQNVFLMEQLDCSTLIQRLPVILEETNELLLNNQLFHRWVRCSEELLLVLKGFALLSTYLENNTKKEVW